MEWGKVKFNPRKNNTESVEPATPWFEFKKNICKDERETQNAKGLDMESKEAKQFLNQRNQNYRRMLINSKRNEPTKWEEFNESPSNQQSHSSKSEVHDGKKFQKFVNGPKSHINKKNINRKHENPFASQDNSSSGRHTNKYNKTEHWNFKQKNTARKILTKIAYDTRGSNLSNAIEDLKRHGVIKKKNVQFKK